MVLARHILCAVGSWTSFSRIDEVVNAYGGAGFVLDRDRSQLTPDPRLRGMFDKASKLAPMLEGKELGEIGRHTGVAYVLGPPMEPSIAAATSVRALALIGALLDAGAAGVKSDSAGIAHPAAQWRALGAAALSEDHAERSQALYKAFVRRPIAGKGVHYTCGLHLLGQRDVEVAKSREPYDDMRWLDLMGIYQVGERPDGGIHAGEAFGMETDGERRVLQEEPCVRFSEDSPLFNPQGYWRLIPLPGAAAKRKRLWSR